MDKKLNTWPEQIYLQHGADELPDYAEVRGCDELTWCADNIHAGDVRYVRADLAERASNPASSAPVAAIKTWQERRQKSINQDEAMRAEIADLRAALATAPQAQAVPVGKVISVRALDGEAVVRMEHRLNGHPSVDVGDILYTTPPAAAAAPSVQEALVISGYDLERVKALKVKFVDSLIYSGIQYRTCGAISATLNQIIDRSEAAINRAAAPSTAATDMEGA